VTLRTDDGGRSAAASLWDDLLASHSEAEMCGDLADRMRAGRLTFGGRLLCPFLRPFFVDAADEARIARAVETLWRLGEELAQAAAGNALMLEQLGLNDDEIRLVQMDPGYTVASTAARADAFLLPGSLQFAEYNGESPAGPGYSQRLSELFYAEPLMARFRERFDVRFPAPIAALLAALVQSYRDWGGTAKPPRIAIVDWREVPTWSEFELLRDAFTAAGVPTVIADPRDLELLPGPGRPLLVAGGEAIDLVYRRVLVNDVVARPDECRVLVEACRAGAVCVANSFRCKIAHKKSFFAALTDERWADIFDAADRAFIQAHVPWTRVVTAELAPEIRRRREQLVLKPADEYGGKGVTLGWETGTREWDQAIELAIGGEADDAWIVQERIAVRREAFPVCDGYEIVRREMLVDFAPYVFRGRVAGFLTRLSATGLANVTSGGGQVPAFVVENKRT
jgi:hypothetical protein